MTIPLFRRRFATFCLFSHLYSCDSKELYEFSLARSVAASRAIASERLDLGYHEPLAKLFVTPEAMEHKRALTTLEKGEIDPPVIRHMIIDKFLEEALASPSSSTHERPRQVVILGAGFDTRAHRMDHLPVRWFEVDLPAPQELKERILKEHLHRSSAANHRITRIPLDLTGGSPLARALAEAPGWDPTAPTYYIIEGLLYYMSAEQAKALLYSIPAGPPGTRIVVTILQRYIIEKMREMNLLLKLGWKTSLEELKMVKAFPAHFKLARDTSSLKPRQNGIKLQVGPKVGPRALGRKGLLRKIQSKFFSDHFPYERILEFENISRENGTNPSSV